MPLALRHAWRALLARPALTLGILITLALGVGANAAMLGALDALLFRAPAHVTNAEQVGRVYIDQRVGVPGGGISAITSYPFFAALRRQTDAFAGAAAVIAMTELSVGSGATAERVPGRAVSANYFALLGARPALGRFFTPADDRPDAAPEVVLGYRYWQRAFGGDPAVIGRTLTLGARRARVVGVAPADFAGLDYARVDLWVPVMAVHDNFGGSESLVNNTMGWLRLVVRRRPGVSDARAAAAATAAYREGDATGEYPNAQTAAATHVRLGPVQAARGPDAGDAERLPIWLAAMSAVLLAAAAANATGLLLTRALERRRTVALQRALGARRVDLARGAVAEALVLAVGSAALAAVLASALGAALRRWMLGEAFATLPVLDGRRLLVVGAMTVIVCLTAALVAIAVAARGVGGVSVLRAAESRGATQAGARTLRVLVAGQVALTFVLLVGAGLFTTSLRRALDARIGFDANRVLLVQIGGAAGADEAANRALYANATSRLAAAPGVEGVAQALMTPLHGVNGVRLRVPGLDSVPAMPGGGPYLNAVTPNYFAVSGTRLLAGRAPTATATTPADTARPFTAAAREVVISAVAARALWPGQNPLGHCIFLDDATACATVVGVAEDARRFALVEDRAMQVYVANDFIWRPSGTFLVRTRGPAGQQIPAVRRAIATLGASVSDVSVNSMAEDFAPNYAPYRAGAGLLGMFGALALALAGAGLFGTVSYALAQRRREIGIRLALGARAEQVGWLLARGGLGPVALGILLGAVLALVSGHAARALLYGVLPSDPGAALAAAAVLCSAAGLACWLPVRRAGRVPPAEVLRAE